MMRLASYRDTDRRYAWISTAVALAIVCTAVAPQAQIEAQPTRERNAFDAVSIRESRSESPPFEIRSHPSGLTATDATALDLVRYAFDVIDADVVGELPPWITTKRFDVVAKSSAESLTRSRLRSMSRTMLQDRFRLEASYERAEGPVYALVMERSDGKGGPNLRRSSSTCVADPLVKDPSQMPVRVLTLGDACGVSAMTNSGGLSAVMGTGVTMQQLARAISRYSRLDSPVVDQTGLNGEFDLLALVTADIAGATEDARFLTALREQLGLTLKREQGSYEVLRVRRITQTSPN